MKTLYRLAPLSTTFALLIGLAMFLMTAACTPTPAVREITVTKEVPVPYHQPCPSASDKPVQPTPVHVDHPTMPKDASQPDGIDWRAVSRILGAKILDWIDYGAKADGVMTACSRP